MAEIKIAITAQNGTQKVFKEVEASGKSAFEAIRKEGQTAASIISTSFKEIAGAMVAYKAMDWAKDLAQGIIVTASAFEKSRIMLDRLMGSASAGKQAFDWLLDLSTKAPIGIEALQNSFIKLQVAGLDPMSGSLKTLVDSISAFGGSSQELQRASVAIQQMAGKGVVSMEELRQQLGETMPTAMKIMAREMGMSLSELSKKVGEGAVDSATGLNALFKGLKKEYDGAAADMMKSFDGILQGLKTELMKFGVEIAEAGMFDALKDALKGLSDWMKDAKKTGELRVLANEISTFFRVFIGSAELATKALRQFSYMYSSLFLGGSFQNLTSALNAVPEKYQNKITFDIPAPPKLPEAAEPAGASEKVKKLGEEWEKTRREMEKEISTVGMNEFERKIIEIQDKASEYAIKWKDVATGQVDIENWKNVQIFKAWEEHKKSFVSMLQGMNIARQKAADEAQLASGNLFAMPKGALAEVDVWFSQMAEKYRDNAEMMVMVANEGEARRFEIMRDWAVKRLEKEKESTQQQISALEVYKQAAEKTYNDLIAKAKEYAAVEQDLTNDLAKRQQFLATGFSASTASPLDKMKGEREAMEGLVSMANQSWDPGQLKSAMTSVEEFTNKYRDMKDNLNLPVVNPVALENSYRELAEKMENVRDTASRTNRELLGKAAQEKQNYESAANQIDVLKKKLEEFDVQIAKTRAMTIDTSEAMAALDKLQTKANGLNFSATAGIAGGGGSGSALESVAQQLMATLRAQPNNALAINALSNTATALGQSRVAISGATTGLGGALSGAGQRVISFGGSLDNLATKTNEVAGGVSNSASALQAVTGKLINMYENQIWDSVTWREPTAAERAQGYTGIGEPDPIILGDNLRRIGEIERESSPLYGWADNSPKASPYKNDAPLDYEYTPPVLGSYASGTSYVPKTGPYWLHQAEVIANPREAKRFISGDHGDRKAAVFSPVTTINNYGVNDPVAIGRAVEKQIFRAVAELNRILR